MFDSPLIITIGTFRPHGYRMAMEDVAPLGYKMLMILNDTCGVLKVFKLLYNYNYNIYNIIIYYRCFFDNSTF